MLTCALDSFDSLIQQRARPACLRATCCATSISRSTMNELRQAFAEEILANIGIQFFEEPRCATQEHPGKVRTQPFPGGEFPPPQVRVCRVNSLRTGNFAPPLALGDYTPDEVHQVCHVVLEGNEAKQMCEVQTTNCPGTDVGGLCLRLQEVEAGQAVLLEGVNFSSVDTKVRTHRRGDVHDTCGTSTPKSAATTRRRSPKSSTASRCRSSIAACTTVSPFACPTTCLRSYDFQVMVPNVARRPRLGRRPVLQRRADCGGSSRRPPGFKSSPSRCMPRGDFAGVVRFG